MLRRVAYLIAYDARDVDAAAFVAGVLALVAGGAALWIGR